MFGDLHIPTRRDSIPADFYEHIQTTNYDLALVTGDLVHPQALDRALPKLPPVHIVKGNMDMRSNSPFHEEIQIENFGFLLLHGTQLRPRGNISQLWEILRDLHLDVAVHGHTHKHDIQLYNGRLFLNPGTITGATGGWPGRDDASFLELKVDSATIKVTLFLTDWQVVKKSELSFQKQNGEIVQA